MHHAYFIEGEKEPVLEEIENLLKKTFGMTRSGHPDIHYCEHHSFGIDEGRDLRDRQSKKPLVGHKKIFIIVLRNMTDEAQNSLLKIWEEPTPDTHFFIISPSKEILLPTLRSRLTIITHSSSKEISLESEAKEFISALPKNRLAAVAEMIEEKNKARAGRFLNAVVAELHKKRQAEKSKTIKEILFLSKCLADRSPSLKIILERVALLDL